MRKTDADARIILFGLDGPVADELARALRDRQQIVCSHPFLAPHECLDMADQAGANLAFCSSERDRYLALLNEIGHRRSDLHIIVVSRTPEVAEWLDAIEAGASDYCAPPFEPSHLRWIIDSALHHPPVLYRTAG